MERSFLKILHGAFWWFLRIPAIYFKWDTMMKIKKKSFSRTTYTPPEELVPAETTASREPEPP
jgi:hypothetical protein